MDHDASKIDYSYLNENSVQVKSLKDFVGVIEERMPKWNVLIHRGQHPRGNLLPGVARSEPTFDTTAREKEMLSQLNLMGAHLLDEPSTSLDRLVAAQHYGMKTRLLDWTSNPLAALWFACEDRHHLDEAHVYSLAAFPLLEPNAHEKDPFDFAKTVAIQPRLRNARVIAQQGWFTLHPFSKRSGRFVRLEAHQVAKGQLLECRIPAEFREPIAKSLEWHGISARTIFPDLSGLCTFLNWKHASTIS